MQQHILYDLSLPDRYETLKESLGNEVATLLVQPPSSNVQSLQILSQDVATRSEGLLVPVYGKTGTGKTTFVENVGQWLPQYFGPTMNYDGEISFEGLTNAVVEFRKSLPANNRKVLSINIDHRENAPPSDRELASIKRFLRTGSAGAPIIIFWPETDSVISQQISDRYIDIAGNAPIDLPLKYDGPLRNTWAEIATNTLILANSNVDVKELGVIPEDYEIDEYPSLGAFLRRMSQDFNKELIRMRSELEIPVSIVIAFASQSTSPGVLSQLTSSSRYGLLDGQALVSVTAQSVIGKWWAARRGLLTRTIVQLNARAVCIAPVAAVSCVRNFTDDMPLFDDIGYRRYGPARAVRDLKRSDLGKVILGENIARHEARGNPAEDAGAAFQLLAEAGFNLGKDKKLNYLMRNAVQALMEQEEIPYKAAHSEVKLSFCPLIPDNSIITENGALCIEYTWRTGDFLSSNNRSATAQYILTKLKNYARELGWIPD